MICNIRTWSFAIVAVFGLASFANGEQYPVQTPAGEKIVHTRLTPVLLHRAVPPYLGRHIYRGRVR